MLFCRVCDDVVSVAKLCAELGVTHVVNNAYGVQSAVIMQGMHSQCFLFQHLYMAPVGSKMREQRQSLDADQQLHFVPAVVLPTCVHPAALTTACRRGRVDAIVQSTDKNFMVPVGGAVLTAPTGKGKGWLVDAVAKAYPGRAAMTPLLDLLTTLLYWGAAGWREKLQQREELFVYLR